jgi:PhzF family phenazine biosynthesis protein
VKQKLYIVDAFTNKPFSGNPAAVCLMDSDSSSIWMQSVAAEMNLSETAFLLPLGRDEWNLRWFTPETEVDLCGHATLAASHVLWHECRESGEKLSFQTRGGLLRATQEGDRISLDFPADFPNRIPIDQQVVKALGVTPLQIYQGREDLLLLLDSVEELYRLEPDMHLLSQVDTRGVIVTARSDRAEYDFISRFFAPSVGIPEDSVTGSAHCALGPFWGEHLERSELTGFQASKRGGVVGIKLMGQRVKLIGSAITTLRGELFS